MTFRTESRHTAQHEHPCDYCGQVIAPGMAYKKIAGKWDGEFYFARGHLDCVAMWGEAYKIWADPSEAMAFYLPEAAGDDWSELLSWRGRYPHVICRIELGEQKSDLLWATRLLAETTYKPDPSEYLHGDAG